MATLQYNIAVTGERYLKRSLRSVEQALKAHERRVNARGGVMGGGTPYRTAAATSRRTVDPMAKAFGDIAKVAAREERKRHTQRLRNIETEKRAAIRAEKQAAKAAERKAARVAKERQRRGTAITRRVGGRGAQAATVAGGALALATGGAIADEMRFDKTTRGIANQAYRKGGPSRETINERVRGVATTVGARGHGANTIAEGLGGYVALTGDLDTGAAIAGNVSDVASATGASVEDVYAVAGESMQALAGKGIKGAEAVKQLNEILERIGAQGKLGSIEFKELASQMAKVTASATGIKGHLPDVVAEMVALGQLAKARGGSVSAEDATTALTNMRNDMTTNAKRFKKAGVDVFERDSKGKAIGSRGAMDVLTEVYKKTGGDYEKTSKLFGIRGNKAARPIFDLIRERGGGKKGMEAMLNEFNTLKDARLSPKELRESAEFAQSGSAAEFAKANEEFNRAVAKDLLPALTKLVPEFAKLTPQLGKAAEAFAKFITYASANPWEGIGAVVTAAVIKDVGAAGLGKAVSAAITAAIGGGTTPPPGGKPGSVKGTLATGGAVAAWTVALDQARRFKKETGAKMPTVGGVLKGALKVPLGGGLGFVSALGDVGEYMEDSIMAKERAARFQAYNRGEGNGVVNVGDMDERFRKRVDNDVALRGQTVSAKDLGDPGKTNMDAMRDGARDAGQTLKQTALEMAAILKDLGGNRDGSNPISS